MKNKRTIRSMKRAGLLQDVGYIGLPSGKRVGKLARLERAILRLGSKVGTQAYQIFTRRGIAQRLQLKSLTRFSQAAASVQEAWLNDSL